MVEYRKRLRMIREMRRARIAELEQRENDLNQEEKDELTELRIEDKTEWKKRRSTPESRKRAVERARLYKLRNPDKVRETSRLRQREYKARRREMKKKRNEEIFELESRISELNEDQKTRLASLKSERDQELEKARAYERSEKRRSRIKADVKRRYYADLEKSRELSRLAAKRYRDRKRMERTMETSNNQETSEMSEEQKKIIIYQQYRERRMRRQMENK